jgi:hypothetical protein
MKGIIDIGTMILIAGAFTVGSIMMLALHKTKLEIGIEDIYKTHEAQAALYSLLNSEANGKTILELISEYEVSDISNLLKQKLEKIFNGRCYKLMLSEKTLTQSEKVCEFKYHASYIVPLPGNRVEKLRLLT